MGIVLRIKYNKNRKVVNMNTEKLKNLGSKAKKAVLKLNKKAVISAVAVLILGVAVLLNFLLVPGGGIKEAGSRLKTKLDLSDVSAAVEKKEMEEESSEKDAFSEMNLTRKRSRDEALEVLNTVALSDTAVESVKTDAMNEIEQIAKDIESEANIESLVKAKGFEQCVAVVNGDSASIIIKTDGLLQNEVAQISEIVYKQAGVRPEDLKIIESD